LHHHDGVGGFPQIYFWKSDNLNWLYTLLEEIYRPKQNKQKLMNYFLEFKKHTEEMQSLLACKTIDKMIAQQKKLIALSWLSSLDLEYKVVRSQILSSEDIYNLTDVFSKVMQSSFEGPKGLTESEVLDHSTLVIQNGNFGGRSGGRGGCGREHGGGRGTVQCYNCRAFGHYQNQCTHPPQNQQLSQ